MHPASLSHHREEARDQALLHSSQAIADIRGKLELLGFDCSLESVAKLIRSASRRELGSCWRLISPANMRRATMHSAKQIAHALLERIIAVRASEAAGRAKISECRGAEGAARSIALRRLHCLVYALEEIGDLWLWNGSAGFDTALCGAPLAQVQQAHACALYLSELNYRIRFLAHITHHTNPPTR
jgi:hypothetical protein